MWCSLFEELCVSVPVQCIPGVLGASVTLLAHCVSLTSSTMGKLLLYMIFWSGQYAGAREMFLDQLN